MGYITIVTLFLIAALLAVRLEEDFYDTFPMTISAFILIMYLAAFIKGLPYLDFVACGILIGIVMGAFLLKGRGGKQRFFKALRMLISPKSCLLLLVMIVITLLVKDKAALWWDDINYWAVDAKALYFNGGFAGKYGNVAPEFGDYPPALQLFKWFFLHLSSEFKEGLMFGAYYCLNLIYLLPLLSRFKKNNPLWLLLGLAGIFLIPGIVDGIAPQGTCADVTMGLVYGAFLWAAYDEKENKEAFYFVRMTLYLCVLVLTKSVGIEWAFFGMLFFVLLYTKRLKERGISFKCKIKPVITMAGLCLMTEGSWLAFCLLNRRVAKLTGAGIKIAASGNFTLPDNTMEKAGHYLRGFAFWPMHGMETIGFDLSSLALLICVIAVVFIFCKAAVLKKWEMIRFQIFIILTAFAAYGIIFLGHLTIFAGELQYLDDAVMAKSIARYGAPFSVGLLYLLMAVLIKKKNKMTAYGICFAFVVLTTSFPGAYQTLYGYRSSLEEEIAGRDSMVEEEAQLFMQKILQAKEQMQGEDIFKTRTLYLRDDHTIHWVKDTHISYAVSPVPVVYGGIATDTMTEPDMMQRIRESHADYLYADKVDGNPDALFAGMLSGEAFEYETFYRIIEENGVIRLQKLME